MVYLQRTTARTYFSIPYSKKLWWSKSLVKRVTARYWWKKLWRMLTCIANFQSLINSKMKPNDTIPKINEYNKTNSIFSLCHVLVMCCLMMARCTVESMIHGYHQYISKLSFENEPDFLKCCNIDILISILRQNKLKRTSRCCACLMLQNRNIGKKVGELLWFAKYAKVFSLPKFFTVRYDSMNIVLNVLISVCSLLPN